MRCAVWAVEPASYLMEYQKNLLRTKKLGFVRKF